MPTITTDKPATAKRPAKNVTPRPKAATKPATKASPAKAATPPAPATASTDRIERLNLAKAEFVTLQAWEKAGSKGDRPATPNLDAANEGNGKPKAKAAAGPRKAKNPRRAVANECKADKWATRADIKRTKVTDEELNTLIVKVRAEFPDSTREDELEVAYWCDELLIGRNRWNEAWDAIVAGTPKVSAPKAEKPEPVKAEATKKAPAKAAAKKAATKAAAKS